MPDTGSAHSTRVEWLWFDLNGYSDFDGIRELCLSVMVDLSVIPDLPVMLDLQVFAEFERLNDSEREAAVVIGSYVLVSAE
jgi:hypothetical protein